MKIPLVDLKRQYASIKSEIDPKVLSVMENTAFILGANGNKFESDFAAFCGAQAAVSLNSGTDALALALMALDIKQGDEVILPANTFIATAGAVSHVGAIPVLVDVDRTYNIDASKVKSVITNKTKAIIPVHLYGQPAEMGTILELAKRHNLKVVEDACQAHGAEYRGKRVGSLGNIAAFSFYPGKNLGAYGDGGAIVTNELALAEKVKSLRNHGSIKKYHHDVVGYNSRLDEIQAAVLIIKLKHLEQWNAKRRENAGLYGSLLQELVDEGLIVVPQVRDRVTHVYHLYVVQVAEEIRDRLIEHLNSAGIGAQIHYPVPIHLQKAYQHLGYKEGYFPATERIVKRIVSLPMFPEIEPNEIEYVVQQIKTFLKGENSRKWNHQAVTIH